MKNSPQVSNPPFKSLTDFGIRLANWEKASTGFFLNTSYDEGIFENVEEAIFSRVKNILFKTNIFKQIREKYDEPHRFYHNKDHLKELITLLFYLNENKKLVENEEFYDLLIVAYFHDCIYDPHSRGNERASANTFLKITLAHFQIDDIKQHPHATRVTKIYNAIIATSTHQASDECSELFNALDLFCLTHYPVRKLIEYEYKIFKEFQFLDYDIYFVNRLKVLEKFRVDFGITNLNPLINYVTNRRIKIGIYPGSFRPFHLGHLNILEQAEKLFDKVILLRGFNPDKNQEVSWLTDLEFITPNRQTDYTHKYLVDYLIKKQESELFKSGHVDYFIVKGLRNSNDLEAENKNLIYSKFLASDKKIDFKTTYFISPPELQHISSSDIRAMEKIKQGSAEKLFVYYH